MDAIPSPNVVGFPALGETSMSWQVLSVANSARQLGECFAWVGQQAAVLQDASAAETKLADEAADLSQILERLAGDLNQLRSRYL